MFELPEAVQAEALQPEPVPHDSTRFYCADRRSPRDWQRR